MKRPVMHVSRLCALTLLACVSCVKHDENRRRNDEIYSRLNAAIPRSGAATPGWHDSESGPVRPGSTPENPIQEQHPGITSEIRRGVFLGEVDAAREAAFDRYACYVQFKVAVADGRSLPCMLIVYGRSLALVGESGDAKASELRKSESVSVIKTVEIDLTTGRKTTRHDDLLADTTTLGKIRDNAEIGFVYASFIDADGIKTRVVPLVRDRADQVTLAREILESTRVETARSGYSIRDARVVGDVMPARKWPQRHVEPTGGFSMVPPQGWETREMPGFKYSFFTGSPANGFAPNIGVVDERYSGSLHEYATASMQASANLFEDFRELSRESFFLDSGERGIKSVTENRQNGRFLAQTFYFVNGLKKKFVITCTKLKSDERDLGPEFFDSVRTFRVEK